MSTNKKWGKAFWRDTGERVGTTAIYGVITFLTLGSTSLDYSQVWPVIALPSVLSLCKALLVNLGQSSTSGGTASLVGVKSVSAP